MTTIVTGATGFIGRHLVNALANARVEVRCLTRGPVPDDERGNVTWYRANFGKSDLGLSDEVLRGATTVYHLAGATRAVSAVQFREANTAITERFADRVIGLGGKPRFVLVSSQAAAGPALDANHPKRETDPAAPIENYGRSKLAAERAIAARGDELPSTIVRPVAVFGPGDRDFLSIFAMARRGVAVYPGTRRSSVNTIYVNDLVAGLIAAAQSANTVGQTYFLGDDTARPWPSIYSAIAEVVGQSSPIAVSVPRSIIGMAGAVGDFVGGVTGRASIVNSNKAMLAMPKYWLCTSERARKDFAFATPTSLLDGMRMTYDWYLQRRWL